MELLDQRLHCLCASTNATGEVERLLKRGANIDAQNKHGVTPLMLAMWHGRLQMAKFLIARGASTKITSKFKSDAIGCAEKRGHTYEANEIRKFLGEREKEVLDASLPARMKEKAAHCRRM